MGRGYNKNCVLYPQPLRWWNYFLLFCMCHLMMGLTSCYKTAVFYIYICCLSVLIHSWEATSAFTEQTDAICKFWFWASYRHRHVILHGCTSFYPNWTISNRVTTLCRFSNITAIPSQIYILPLSGYRKLKNCLHTKFWPNIWISILSLPCDSTLAYLILCKLDDRRRSYNVISILHDGGHGIANPPPGSGLATSYI